MVRFPVCSFAAALAVLAAYAVTAQSQSTPNADQHIVSASTLTRTHAVTPTWPASAEQGVEGWVHLTFTVMPDGTVSDVEVSDANPAGVFDESAVQALSQWRFEPVERNGEKIAQRAKIRMNYSLGQ